MSKHTTGDRVRIKGGQFAGLGTIQPPEHEPQAPNFVTVRPDHQPGMRVTIHEGQIERYEGRPSFTRLVPPGNTTDLKPRGVKRQWWLMPLDALSLVLDLHGEALGLTATLAAYQRAPRASTAARVAGAGLVALMRTHEVTLEAALDLVVQVFEHGAEKYTADNWRGAATAETAEAFRREYLSAMCRHAFPLTGMLDEDHTLPDGTRIKGSGLPHLAHLICGGLMVTWHEMHTFTPSAETVEQ